MPCGSVQDICVIRRIYRAAFFPMQDLARQVPGTVQLGVLDQDYVLFIHSVGYSGAPHAFADVGLRRPLNATASGKIFLAGMAPDALERIMAKSSERYTSSTITSLAKMKQEIVQVRKMRYARNVEELLPGYWVLAAGVGGQENCPSPRSVLRSLWKSCPRKMRSSIAGLVKEAARKASLQLGHAGGKRGVGSWP